MDYLIYCAPTTVPNTDLLNRNHTRITQLVPSLVDNPMAILYQVMLATHIMKVSFIGHIYCLKNTGKI